MSQNETNQNNQPTANDDKTDNQKEAAQIEPTAAVEQLEAQEQIESASQDADKKPSEDGSSSENADTDEGNQSPYHELTPSDQGEKKSSEDDNPLSSSSADENSQDNASSSEELTMQLNEDLIGDKQKHWYVINTYSGYEDNVRQALKQRIDSMDMAHKIFDVVVPKEKKVEIRNGKKKIVEKKIFPGYVLVQMIVDEDSWYVVRNTPNVTGFIGFGSKPTPLSDEETKKIQKRMGIEEPEYKIDFQEGESVQIIDGPFKDFDGVIAEIDKIRGKIKVLVSMFGRETPVELDALQIKRI